MNPIIADQADLVTPDHDPSRLSPQVPDFGPLPAGGPCVSSREETCFSTSEELVRMALTGTDLEFQQAARLCEDEGIALQLLRGLRSRRAQVDAWFAYLAELHPALADAKRRSQAEL